MLIENLYYLLEVIDKIDFKHFEMRTRYEHHGEHKQAKPRILDCETVACLAGWAAMHPKLRAQGLSHGFHTVNYPFGQRTTYTLYRKQLQDLFPVSGAALNVLFYTDLESDVCPTDEEKRAALRSRVYAVILDPNMEPDPNGEVVLPGKPEDYGIIEWSQIGEL